MRCSLPKCQLLTPQGKNVSVPGGCWGRGAMQANRNRWESGLCLKFKSKWPREKFHPELLLAIHCMPAATHQLQTPKCAFLLPPTMIQLPGTKLGSGISVLKVTPSCVPVGSSCQGGSCRAGLQLGRLPSIREP